MTIRNAVMRVAMNAGENLKFSRLEDRSLQICLFGLDGF
jgi:hypothetical protein